MDRKELISQVAKKVKDIIPEGTLDGEPSEKKDKNKKIKVDPKEKEMGKEVEKEHRETILWIIQELRPDLDENKIKEILDKSYEKISFDHFKEDEKYYTKLLSLGL